MNADARQALLVKLQDLLGEHATAFVCMLEIEDETGEPKTIMAWSGGFNFALGLSRRLEMELEQTALQCDGEPPDETEQWKEA